MSLIKSNVSAPMVRNNRSYATREREYATCEHDERGYGYQDYSQDETSSIATRGESVLGNTTGGHTPGDIGLKPIPRQSSSGKLPPYDMCDSVCVMKRGRLVKQLTKNELSQELIMKYAAGG